ncbi:TetR/AcrR family transcriptional regulator [Williamsia sterculiae]|uniref:Transcriptional regulator, TetR family n=1 Tax=Williamsia sterculiae TaxID=1344003 RepID=A0A1N7H759_9NOCA|nr:TetR/AcrR family transcriptional regulator [Williamsia sterculiae]SIS20696.1 transcriptional regulator, TetR family [Williamsia sterculiae]
MDLNEPPRRRRGAALQEALLEAAWAELAEVGYGAMTYEGVARRAATSRPVVYRRWPTKPEMTRAAIQHYYDHHRITAPDTGSLRGDLITLLDDVSSQRAEVVATLTVRLSAFYEETGTQLADLRTSLVHGARPIMDPILHRAMARGEIDTTTVSPRVSTVPLDLIRNELMFGPPVTRATIESIVDEVFLPLVRRPEGSR